MSDDWKGDVRHLFEPGGRLDPATCPALTHLVRGWLVEGAELPPRRLEELVRSVLWNADRKESRAQTGLDWSELQDRRSAREGVLGFLFLPPMDESVGLPRTLREEQLVRGLHDHAVNPHLQSHRSRSAWLRELIFQKGREEALTYKASTLLQHGRVANANGRYADRLVDDLIALLNEPAELAIVLNDVFLVTRLRQEWIDAYEGIISTAPLDWRPPDRRVRSTATSELDREVETLLDASEFVADVTVPDGTMVPMGATVTKTWRIRNAGSVPWVGRRLRRVTPQTNTFPVTPVSVPIADTAPGREVDISVDITATHIEGMTELRFKMVDGNGTLTFPDRYTYGLVACIETVRPTGRSDSRL